MGYGRAASCGAVEDEQFTGRRPVALVHGHSHFYRLTSPWDRAPNLTELQTFALHDTDWWVDVAVDPAGAEVFRFAKEQS